MEEVLRECARLLDLDEDRVVRSGALMLGASKITSLWDLPLQGGPMHEVTLVLSS